MHLRTLAVPVLSILLLAACDGVEESTPEAASSVASPLGETITGTLSATGTSWRTHDLVVPAAGDLTLTLSWTKASADFNLFLIALDGTTVAHANGTTARPETITFHVPAGGTYKAGIKAKKGSSTYTLTSAFVPDGVTAPSYPGRPADGTLLWGASVPWNVDLVARHEVPAGHNLTLHRSFYQWNQRTTGLVTNAEDDTAHGRLPWVSVKTPSWAAMGAGTHDAEIDAMLNALDDVDGPVWLTLHHEPEGGGGVNTPDDPGGPSAHVAMNRRVRQRMTALGVDNVALAPILMTYTWKPGSGRNPEDWWAPGIYDFLGADHYEDAEVSPLDDSWFDIRAFAESKGVDLAIGEWGMRGTNAAAGARMREFYDHVAGSHADGQGGRVVGLSYFDSGQNAPSGTWELKGAQLSTFHALLNDPRTANPQ